MHQTLPYIYTGGNNTLRGPPPTSTLHLEMQGSPLVGPVRRDEIGLGLFHPDGMGAGMNRDDSNSLSPIPDTLLTNYTTPEAIGESSMLWISPQTPNCRIIKLDNTGNQEEFLPTDMYYTKMYSNAYTSGENTLRGELNYNTSYDPESSLSLECSPGQYNIPFMGTENAVKPPCEDTYPRAVRYNLNGKTMCITSGDIPYGEVLNGRVNPRLIDRWQNYTNRYNAQEVTRGNGLLYPKIF